MDKKSTIKLACDMIIASEKMDRAGKTKEAKILLENSLNMIKKSNFLHTLGREIAGELPKAKWWIFKNPFKTFSYKGLEHLENLAKRKSKKTVRQYLNALGIKEPSPQLLEDIINTSSLQEIYELLRKSKLLEKTRLDKTHFTPLTKLSPIPVVPGISHGLKQKRKPVFESERPIFEENEPQPEQKPKTDYNFY